MSKPCNYKLAIYFGTLTQLGERFRNGNRKFRNENLELSSQSTHLLHLGLQEVEKLFSESSQEV